ncbi:hypothetical protein CBL_11793 [Carabus blaptoides fortunei]
MSITFERDWSAIDFMYAIRALISTYIPAIPAAATAHYQAPTAITDDRLAEMETGQTVGQSGCRVADWTSRSQGVVLQCLLPSTSTGTAALAPRDQTSAN